MGLIEISPNKQVLHTKN